MSDFLVLGPLIALQTPESSGRYYAMNLNNGAWAQWDVYGNVFHNSYVIQGNTDTLKCQGFSGTVVSPAHGYFQLGTSEKGTVLVFMNYNETQGYVADGLSTAQRIPNYVFETKNFTFSSNVEFKKVYRIQIDRGLGTTDAGGTAYDKGGFGAHYQSGGELAISSSFVEIIQSAVDNQFGNLAHSQFRALSFSLFYEFYYINQQTFATNVVTKVYRFKINGMFVYVDSRADFSGVQLLGTT
jgi:hypothetical protein